MSIILRNKPLAEVCATKPITSNPKNLQFLEVEHALVPVSFKDSDLAIMAGAYTIIHADLLPKRDSIYLEQDNQEYDSVLVSNSKASQKPEVQLVKEAFIADDTREFVLKNYADTVTWPKR
ncbi:MetQ/NlpA family ABC transporter substrate-binding protein [Acinetobacter lwoffii]|uniref:MetQ/NlpA family ABC transporter substrate-binding protein n=1 Tax=Acinetobacter lwoffii TaxID=28090 RepID=A0AAJ4TSC1_ACILW|nr:MetQ/NlpA family ABC transporter substrate-binding protein [Acinetobacter lwoffii]